MKELKIDQKLAALFKPLEKEQLDELEEKLKAKYDGTPLYVWKGDIIVDGHNRYPIMKKYNIDFNVENVEDFLGEDCSRSDVMQWMISHQEARRNLSIGEKLSAYSMMQKEIALENKEKMSTGGKIGADITNGKTACVHLDAPRNRSTNTREQIAKMAGVAVGTVARYNRVMNSDDENLKEKVNSGEVTVNRAYEEVRKKEKEKENISNENPSVPKTYKEAAQLYGGIQQGHLPNRKNKEVIDDGFTEEQLVNALISAKTPVNVLDSIIPKQEFDIMSKTLLENVESCDYRIFDLHEVYKKMEKNDLDYAIEKFDSVITAIMELEEKIKKSIKGEN
nr:hypothetical protein [Clostridium sp. Marseille-P7770]